MTEKLKLEHALDAISKDPNGTAALEILSVITYFAPENIHTELLSNVISDENELEAAIQLLIQCSIVHLGQDKTTINIDRTIQRILISAIENEDANLRILEQTLTLFFIQGVNSTNLDHAMSVWSHISAHKELIEKFFGLPNSILIELNKQLRYKEGERFGWKALDVMKKMVGKSHSGTLVLQHNLGTLLGNAGDLRKALEVLVPLYGKNKSHLDQRAIRDMLITIARQVGELSRYPEALKIYEETLLCNQTVFEANDDQMLSAWHNYSRILCEMGKLHRASEILKDILKRRSQIFDKEDDETLSLKSSLAHVLIKEGKYSEALKIFEIVFDQREKLFGANHAITLRTKRDIALVFQHQSRLDEALVVCEEVTEKFQQVLGIEHPETLAIQTNIATLFQQRGDFQRALDTYRYLYKKLCNTLGEKHIEPLRVKHRIAEILFIQQKIHEALKILREVYEAYVEVLGPKHPETLDLEFTLHALDDVHCEARLESIYSAVCEGNLERVKDMIQSGIDINDPDLHKKTPLHYAAQFGYVSIVKLLLEKGAIYNAQSEGGHTPFQITGNSEIKTLLISVAKLIKDSKEGNHEQISKYIAEHRRILNAKDSDGSNALHWAAHNGHKNIVKLLLESGADPTQVTNKGNTPLHIATSKGHSDIIEILLQYINRDDLHNFINAKTNIGRVTALHVAAKNGSLEIVKSLLKHGAIYSIKNKQGKTPFQLSEDSSITKLLKLTDELFQDAKSGNSKIISKLQHVEDVFTELTRARNDEGNTLLQVIIINEHENIAIQFLEIVKKLDHTEPWASSKWSLDQLEKLNEVAKFHMRSSKTYLSMLRSMSHLSDSEKNVSPWKTLKEGSYYLANAHKLVEAYKACTQGSIDDKNIQAVNASLVELEFDPKHMTVGYTDEAYGGQVECFTSKGRGTKYYKLLHSKLKADVRLFVEMVERDIDLPVKKFLESLEKKLGPIISKKLFKAIETNNHTEVEECIEKGVAINTKNADGGTPLHVAVNHGDISIIDRLLKNGADVTQVTTKGNTPLHIATSKRCKEIVEVLLQHASPDKLHDFVNAQTTIGGTASLHVAARNGSVDIVKSLLKHGAIFDIENKEGKRPIDLSQDQNIIDLLKLTSELFHGVKNGNLEIIDKLQPLELDEFSSLRNACNNQRNTLLQVAIMNKHKNIESKLLEMFRKQDHIQAWSGFKRKLDQLKSLQKLAVKHIQFSGIYLPMLRSLSHPNKSEKNSCPWKTLKQGSYYLENAYSLVEVYKKCMNGVIDDKNIQTVNDTLVELQFHPEYNSAGHTDEAFGRKAQSFVSKGQGKKYYEILHSLLNKDVRLFIKMVERNIDIPVNKLIESLEHEIQSILSEQLFKAIENNNHAGVKDCIKEKVAINSKNTDGGTPLHYAVNNGNLGIINTLLENKADVTQVTVKGNTPLHIAISKGYAEIVQVLLQHTSHDKLYFLINAQTTVGGTAALHIAVKSGSIDVVKSLLKHGAIYNIKDKEGKTPLDFSKHRDITDLLKRIEKLFQDAEIGDSEIVSKLQHTEVDEFTILTNVLNNKGDSLLQVAIYNKYNNMTSTFSELFRNMDQIQLLSRPKCRFEQFKMLQEVTELCIKASQLYLLKLKSMSQSYGSENNSFPLITLKDGFCYLGNAYKLVQIYKWCTKNSIRDEDIQAVYDMLIALEFGPKHIISFYTNEVYHEQLEFFLAEGRGRQYYKLLHSELKKDVSLFIEMVERNIEIPLKKFFESIKQKLQYVRPEKLFEAIESNNLTEIENCIRNGAEVNSKNTNGRTPLHYAVHNGNLDIVNLLLKNKADATQITVKGNTPLHIATSKDCKEIVEVLLQHVSHDKLNDFINAQTIGGTTSLHVAARNGSWDIVMSLLRHGAIYNKRNKDGKIPLDLSQNQNIINLLKLSSELFQDAKTGNPEITSKLQHVELDKFIALVNACNDQGNTLLQVAVTNDHASIASKLSAMIEKPEEMRSWFTPKLSLDQLEQLKEATDHYIRCSQSYLQILRNASQSNRSEKNSFPWATLKAGSYYLQNVHKLVEVYKEYMHGSIDDRNIQAVHHILIELEFDPKHITSGYTDEAFDGKVECFVSKGQGTKYYELLHSDLKTDIRSFVEMVQSNVDTHVKRFLNLINEKFKLFLSEMLFVAIEKNNNIEVKNCLREELVVNVKSTDGRSPLHYAVNNGNINIINTLLKHGADVSQVANNGDTSLHIACSKGQKRIVEVLLQHICPNKLSELINAQMVVEGTSLHIAAKNGFLEVVESLLKRGAIYNVKNQEGKTPLDLSKDQNVTKLLNLIQTLFEDAKSGNFKMIHKLKTQPFKLTAIINTRNNQNETLVQVAVSNKHQDLAAKLDMFIKTKIHSTGY